MASGWYRAAMVQPPKILGVRMRPFSAWHALVLSQFGNPFVCGGTITEGDVIQGLLVCCEEWNENPQNNLTTYWRFCNNPLVRFGWFMRGLFGSINKAAGVFSEYVSTYCDVPEYWKSADAGTETSKVPFSFHLPAVIVANTSISERRAWNMPLSLAAHVKAVIDEGNGAKLVGDDASEADEAILKVEAA